MTEKSRAERLGLMAAGCTMGCLITVLAFAAWVAFVALAVNVARNWGWL